MTIRIIHLRKILQFCALEQKDLERAIRKEIYSDRLREDKSVDLQPMDFYGCFWADAKQSVLHGLDLKLATLDRVVKNKNRKRLYPILEKGFSDWWQNELRGTNLFVTPEETKVHTRFVIPEIEITLKVENFLALKIEHDHYRLIYPYFSEKPPLNDKWIRIGLWLLSEALPNFGLEPMRLLDVQRGKGYSSISHPLNGTEKSEFLERCAHLLFTWKSIKEQVDGGSL